MNDEERETLGKKGKIREDEESSGKFGKVGKMKDEGR
jgi:hypothetical protein